jgi:hypothetical protein
VLWQKDQESRPPIGWVRETRRGRGYAKSRDNSIVLHVDFDGPTLARMPPTATVDAVLWVDANGQVLERQLTCRRRQAGGASRPPRARERGAVGDVELCPAPRLGTLSEYREGRHGSAGASRVCGGLGGRPEPPMSARP